MASKGNITVNVKCKVHKDVRELLGIAEDIGELVDLIPDYQHQEAEKITDEIKNKMKRIIDFKISQEQRITSDEQ